MAKEFKLSYTANDINTRLGKIDSLAAKNELPTKTSDLTNDSGFATETYVDSRIATIPTPDVSGQINAHNTSDSAHADIRSAIADLEESMNNHGASVQPDYAQNDPSAADYIKNRTHWAEDPVSRTDILLPEESANFTDGLFEVTPSPIVLLANTEYIISWDGINYNFVTEEIDLNGNGMKGVIGGNPAILEWEENPIDNGQPFGIMYYEDFSVVGFLCNDTGETQHSISLSQIVTTQEIHKLDDRFINAAWMAQNKEVATEVVTEVTATVTYEDYIVPSESVNMDAFMSAEYFDVVWNGETYRCSPKNYMGIRVIGNMAIAELGADSGEPFMMGAYMGDITVAVPEDIEATFSVTGYSYTPISTIPNEFLPEPLQFGYEHEAEVFKDAITWDGDTTGRATLDALITGFYFVSNAVPTYEDLLAGGIVTDSSGENLIFTEVSQTGFGMSIEDVCMIITEPLLESMFGIPLGIYFCKLSNDLYVTSLTVNNYTFVETETKIKTIDPKYLPEGIGGEGGSGLPEVTAEDNGKSLSVVDGEWQVEQIDYNDLSNKPALFSGSYNDLSDKPALGALASKNSLTASDVGAVPTTRTINGKALSNNISLSASDVGAATAADVKFAIEAAIGAAIAASY